VDGVVANSLEERQALLQAKKREALLLGSAEQARDASGRFKRRDSDATVNVPSRDALDQDALVYAHKIQKNDTMAGVILKYGCQPDVFRKVNRFWPNDNIQVRNHVFLPVDACTIRGKKVDGPHSASDLLGPALEDLAKTTSPGKGGLKRMGTHSASRTPDQPSSPAPEPFPLYNSANDNDKSELQHDSWVSVPNFPEPIAILRMPRSSLGYFPRARRKSLTKTMYSDASPRTSFDTLRHPPSHAAQMSLSHSLTGSPVRHSTFGPQTQRPPSLTRQRSSSTATSRTTTSSTAQQQQPWSLAGPGGVGTLRGLRTEPSRPGPAEDSLNRTFKAYFPDLAITDPQQALDAARSLAPHPSSSFQRTRTPSYRGSPRVSMDSTRSVRSNSSGIADLLGVGPEGWVRKLGGKKGKNGNGGVQASNAPAGMVGGGTGMEDLIELEMTPQEEVERLRWDVNNGGNGEDDLPTPTLGLMSPPPRPAVPGANDEGGAGGARGSKSEQEMLDERFPVRGRVMGAYQKPK
jgi:hypothetical protein